MSAVVDVAVLAAIWVCGGAVGWIVGYTMGLRRRGREARWEW